MEVASPLTFTQAGTKRAFPCSPGLVENTTAAVGMEISEDFAQQPFKRRRFHEHADTTQQSTPLSANPFASSFSNGAFFGRHRGRIYLVVAKTCSFVTAT